MQFATEEHRLQLYQELRCLIDKVRDHILILATRQSVIKLIVRGIHAIKGSSGIFGLKELEEFTLEFERLLLNGTMSLDRDMVELVLEACDAINDMIDAYERGEVPVRNRELSERFLVCLGGSGKEKGARAPAG